MFTRIAGLPVHPLFVHLAVVIVPVAAIVAIVYVAMPRLRERLGLASSILSAVAFVSTVVARSAGEAMPPLMGLSEENPGAVATHADYAMYLLIAVIVMTAGMIGTFLIQDTRVLSKLSFLAGWRSWAVPLGMTITVIGAIASIVTLTLTGHEGASLTWSELS